MLSEIPLQFFDEGNIVRTGVSFHAKKDIMSIYKQIMGVNYYICV